MQTRAFVGVNVGYHNSSACHLEVGKELQAIIYEEERFTRIKNKGLFPYLALQRLAREKNLRELPSSHFAVTNFAESIEETFRKLELHSLYPTFISDQDLAAVTSTNPLRKFVTHHEAHLFSVLPLIRDEKALIVVADGCGSPWTVVKERSLLPVPEANGGIFENVSVYLKSGSTLTCALKLLNRDRFSPELHTISELYNFSTLQVFSSWKAAGKLMGLAAYGDRSLDRKELAQLLSEIPQNRRTEKNEFDSMPEEEFMTLARIARSTQEAFEEEMRGFMRDLRRRYPDFKTLAFVGGSALNCLFNSRLYEEKIFDHLIFSPFPNDEGVSLGAAVAAAWLNGDYVVGKQFLSPSAFLGSRFSLGTSEDIRQKFSGFNVEQFTETHLHSLAELIAQGEIVAWALGPSECGPRALGHRSLFASPLRKNIKALLNDQVKKREAFRPYGISILASDIASYFEVDKNHRSPFMSYSPRVRKEWRELLSPVMHPDFSIRIQTIEESDGDLFRLLHSLKEKTGHGMVLHTSLNVMAEPIVEGLDDVYRFFRDTPVNYLRVEDSFVSKEKS